MGKWYDTKITLKKSDFQNPYHIHKISIFEKDNSSKAILSPAPNLKYYIEELESYTSEDKIYLACTGDVVGLKHLAVFYMFPVEKFRGETNNRLLYKNHNKRKGE